MGLAALVQRKPEVVVASSTRSAMSFNDYLQYVKNLSTTMFAFGGHSYQAGITNMQDHLAEVVSANSAIGACINDRSYVFSEVTFKFQELRNSKPGRLYGTPALEPLESPWSGAATSHLLAAMEADVSVYGNSYWVLDAGQLIRLDPTCVTLLKADVGRFGKRLVGYAYQEKPGVEPVLFLPDEVAHYRVLADPADPFRGRSWISLVLEEADADNMMTGYKTSFLRNSATPHLAVTLEPGVSQEQFDAVMEVVESKSGWSAGGQNLYLGAGVDVKVVGTNWQQLDLKQVQGAGESRIAAAAGVPASIVGFSEGLQGSALNAGNYGAARRRFADGTIRPLWRAACSALSTLVDVPAGSRLWFDASDVSFLQEDEADEATIRQARAATVRALLDAGFAPDAAVAYAATGDTAELVGQHSGLFSVQLQPPGTESPATSDDAEDGRMSHHELTEVRQMFAELATRQAPTLEVRAENVTIERRDDITVLPTPVTVVQAPAPVVNNVVNVPDMPAPVVNAPVTVNMPELPPPSITVPVSVEVPLTKHKVKRNAKGEIIEVTEEPVRS